MYPKRSKTPHRETFFDCFYWIMLVMQTLAIILKSFYQLAFRLEVQYFDVEIVLSLKRATAWNVSKYGVISGPYFPVFGLNIEKYGPEITPYLGTFHAVIMVYSVQDLGQIIVDMSLFERIQVSGNPYMREYRSVETLIWENTGQWKPLFSHILCSVRIKPKANGERVKLTAKGI